MPKVVDYLGLRFTRLLVKERAPNTKQGASAWYCDCDCGKTKVYARSTDLRRGDSQSCGCATGKLIAAANTKHGMARTRLYKVWRAMHDRCYNKQRENYPLYGARGIKVCARWHTFENFYADMGYCAPGLSLERRNNFKGYAPANCYWATRTEQANNQRNNRRITMNDKTQTIAQWARETGHPPLRIWQRLSRGWSVEAALTVPRKGNKIDIHSARL